MMCPKCENEMTEAIQRVNWKSKFGVSRSSRNTKTKIRRTFFCSKCKKLFIIGLAFIEVTQPETSPMGRLSPMMREESS